MIAASATTLRVAGMVILAIGFGLVVPATAPMPVPEQRLRHVLTIAVAMMLIARRFVHR